MTELELLEMYEPVLRFAKSERFFPAPVEAYLEQCTLHSSGADGVVERLERLDDPQAGIGRLKSEQFYLKFVNKSFRSPRAWGWWLIFSLALIFIGWVFFGALGIKISAALSAFASLILFMQVSLVRVRIISSTLAVIAFCMLGFVPIWFFLYPSPYISIAVEYLIALPIYLAILFYVLTRILKFTLDRVIPEGPGVLMDIFSRATEKVAQEAYLQYAQILAKNPQPVYYGRVLYETAPDGTRWTILQYHLFYAFNDWRLAANGMNHHEGDWELIAVYLKQDAPYALLLSQHGAGYFEAWGDALKARDESGAETKHPLVYVALGSHANYSKPNMIRSSHLYEPGRIQRVMSWVDGVIYALFLFLNPHQSAEATRKTHSEDSNPGNDRYVVRLPLELPTGDGFRIGSQPEYSPEQKLPSGQFLKRAMSRRAVTHPQSSVWSRVLLNSEHDWVQYKGLWGVKSWLGEESGPPGPRWERPHRKYSGVRERVRWGAPLAWLEQLEKSKQ